MNADRLQHIAFSVANEKKLDVALHRIVAGLAAEEGVALARIWLIRPGDTCASCPMRSECPDQKACLHLVASDGGAVGGDISRWTRLDGEYRRFPLDVRKVGRIGATGEPVLLTNVDSSALWVRDPDWAQREGILSFAGQPLLFRGEILGVLALFSRNVLTTTDLSVLRLFSDHAAAALANARAFEEIARLKNQLELENEYLRDEIATIEGRDEIIGASQGLQQTLQQVELVAATDASVLIEGETGTGKELIARRIHHLSARSQQPLIKVNCASIPQELFESEFFGHVKGAFTGAVKNRSGRFELADKGTLFLDEVGEIPLDLQSKLLRALQEGTFERIGDERSRKTDVRLIAATNRDLKVECAAGRFRQDLYYRLNVFPVVVPALRDRREDIPLLAASFLRAACKRLGYAELALDNGHLDQLRAYDWPGNIRELQNAVERAAIVSRGTSLHFDLANASALIEESQSLGGKVSSSVKDYVELRNIERQMIIEAVKLARGKISGTGGAAEQLGIKPSTLTSKMASMEIRRDKGAILEE
ncbi:MAG: GAF domain-containing protein [Candidatus Latescibacteria bacterium]|nr:GAF domain-containing protein [Candidatus Latescibacterota bacterium]